MKFKKRSTAMNKILFYEKRKMQIEELRKIPSNIKNSEIFIFSLESPGKYVILLQNSDGNGDNIEKTIFCEKQFPEIRNENRSGNQGPHGSNLNCPRDNFGRVSY